MSMNTDWSKIFEKGEKIFNSLPPKVQVIALVAVSAPTTLLAIPPACKSLTKFCNEFPQTAENFMKGFITLKQGTSNLITDEVYEEQIVDGEVIT